MFCCHRLVVLGQDITQEQTNAIEKRYSDVRAQVERLETDDEYAEQSEIAVNELVINSRNKSWPAVGTFKVTYRFYYRAFGDQPYPDTLVYATKETTSAARMYREEYLFAENGPLQLAIWTQLKPDPEIKVGELSVPNQVKYFYSNSKMIYRSGVSQKGNPDSPSSDDVQKRTNTLYRLFALSIE